MRAGDAAAVEDSRQTRREGEKEKEEEGGGVEKKDDVYIGIYQNSPFARFFFALRARMEKKKKYEIAPKTSAKRSPCIGNAFGSVLAIGEAILRPTGNPCVEGTISLKNSL